MHVRMCLIPDAEEDQPSATAETLRRVILQSAVEMIKG